MKETYVNALNKRAVQEFLFREMCERFYIKCVIGLPGPDINQYLDLWRKLNITNFNLYETSPDIIQRQLLLLNGEKGNIILNHKDVIEAIPDENNIVYDLDFCKSVRYMTEYIKKFKERFIMTFSLRIGVEETINTFFNIKEEKIINSKLILHPIIHTEYITDEGKYLFARYFDTSAMCSFAKI